MGRRSETAYSNEDNQKLADQFAATCLINAPDVFFGLTQTFPTRQAGKDLKHRLLVR
jgi:hypothetical protein